MTVRNKKPVVLSQKTPHMNKQQLSDIIKNPILVPKKCLTPRLTDRLAVSRNVTLTLT
jgi:hypothetical protein